ncbi:hypothetical protein PRZ48_009112 [Zasmidium cellare]|uniref:Gfo/Idh/MocA-like oxidoreductase N-terminal domain-containing protein n=1 Tax=Zasmidium cellare TaxID=395010 RepID=A0ABR0EI18_ZASCE|nr:hypothetical protein PRZ48_009112 [Zasmidium cellare]
MFGMNPTEAAPAGRIVKVGIIGCGLVTQVVHIPTLNNISHLFQITHLYDVSQDASKHAQSKIAGNERPKIASSVEELCNAPDVDVVMICSNHSFHAEETEIALKAGKFAFVEKPIALNLHDTDRIIAADDAAGGGKVMIGYMRRYASAFIDAVKEVGTLGEVRYARVRDIIGPNSVFVGQSGTFPRTFEDYSAEDEERLRSKTKSDVEVALREEVGVEVSDGNHMMWETLSMLGSHDLSAMREILGVPEGVVGFSPMNTTGSPFWSAIFKYPSFSVSYESGVDKVPRFDASIEIFGDTKTVKMVIDTPFVKGLPTTMVVKEALEDGSYRESTIRRTYEDPFTLALREMYDWVCGGTVPKTTPRDARRDLEVLGMLMRAIR